MSDTYCVFAAHPDDEVLGCGGTINKLANQGDKVHITIMATGVLGRYASENLESDKAKAELVAIKQAAQKSAEILKAASIEFLGFPDNAMDTVSRLVVTRAVEAIIDRYQPVGIFTHSPMDVNVDHQATFDAVVTACRPQPDSVVKRLWAFESVSSTEWQPPGAYASYEPNWFEDISENIEAKLRALACYEAELRDWPHARSMRAVEALARWRGATVGVEAAESFSLKRYLAR